MRHQNVLVGLFLSALATQGVSSQSLIIDHFAVAEFDSIPTIYKEAAANLHMLFMDRSVGGNISFYLDCLSNPWSSAPSACKRYQHLDSIYAVDPAEVYWDGTWDSSNWRYEYWPTGCSEDVNCFIDFVSDRLDSFDVLGCQFSYLAVASGSQIDDTLTGFFGTAGDHNKASTYAVFAAAHPDKKIIWWTTSLARSIGTPESQSFNDQMRQYAATQDIILFDVADILSHDPDGNPCYDNRDGVPYKDEDYPDDNVSIPAICPQYTTETDGGHLGSISAGGIRVSKAFWVLMAHLAGWKMQTTSVPTPLPQKFKIFPNPASSSIFVQFNQPVVSTIICKILDLEGKVRVHYLIPENSPANHSFEIPLKGINSGLYIIQLQAGDKIKTQKLIVSNPGKG
jgi:hypothetical protein